MMNSSPALTLASPWISIHVSLPKRIDEFLTEELHPFIHQGMKQDLLKRVFFIRHGEGGPHIRLRMMPGRIGKTSSILPLLSARMRYFAARYTLSPDECSFVQQPYDRTALYFGEKWESVYSELINEQTSILALRFMRACHGSAACLVTVASALLNILLRLTAKSTFAEALQQSTEFASRAMAELNWTQPPADAQGLVAMARAIRDALPRVERMILADPSVGYLVRLLKRARSQCANGEIVVSHSLHLLCNKLGINLALEHELCKSLSMSV